MDIIVIILGIIAVAAGVAAFVLEHSDGDDEKKDQTK